MPRALLLLAALVAAGASMPPGGGGGGRQFAAGMQYPQQPQEGLRLERVTLEFAPMSVSTADPLGAMDREALVATVAQLMAEVALENEKLAVASAAPFDQDAGEAFGAAVLSFTAELAQRLPLSNTALVVTLIWMDRLLRAPGHQRPFATPRSVRRLLLATGWTAARLVDRRPPDGAAALRLGGLRSDAELIELEGEVARLLGQNGARVEMAEIEEYTRLLGAFRAARIASRPPIRPRSIPRSAAAAAAGPDPDASDAPGA